jgi:hypothetical protein
VDAERGVQERDHRQHQHEEKHGMNKDVHFLPAARVADTNSILSIE